VAIVIAKDAGFATSVDNLNQRREVSDAELENLAGGTWVTIEITYNRLGISSDYNCNPPTHF
jgi:hypothetical protein